MFTFTDTDKMDRFIKNGNETISYSHINAIMTFIYLISIQFQVRSFTAVSDMTTDSFVNFQKVALKWNLEMSVEKLIDDGKFRKTERKAFLIFKNSRNDFSRVLKNRPTITVGIFFTKEKNITVPEYLFKLVIPYSTSFFFVQFSENPAGFSSTSSLITGKSSLMYKPIPAMSTKIFPLMYYGGSDENNQTWTWEAGRDWNFHKKEIRNMTGITIFIALVTPKNRETAVRDFLRDKNSFFWRVMEEHLKFKAEVLHEQLVNQSEKSTTSVYLKLLMTNADGLGVLPAISVERAQYLDYVVTGIDSKHQLMVRTPQFVHSWRSIFKPFTTQSWICLGIAICLITFTLRIAAYCLNLTTMDLSSCFLTIFGFVCCQGSTVIANKITVRLICYTALIFSFSIYQFYTSNFYSLLSTKEARLPFTSLEQLIAKRTHSLYMHPETAIYLEIQKAKNGTFKRLREEILMKDPNHRLKGSARNVSLSNVCKGKGAILSLPFHTNTVRELKCKLVSVNSGYLPSNIVLVFKKRFPFKPQFKFSILRLLEAGVSHKFNDEYLDLHKKGTTKTHVINEPVSLEHVAFPLAFYGVSVVISVIVLAFEILGYKSYFKARKLFSNNLLPRKRNFKHN